MFIKPGFTIVISLISKTSLSLFLICSARIKGGFLLILPVTRNLIFNQLGKKYRKEKNKDDLIEGEYEDKDN